jgi:glycoside/pentoside/hexuronide:cation symporter, GPH family
MKLALLGSLVPNALLLLVPREWWEASLLLIMLANFFHMMFIPLLFSAVPDTVDYGLKTIGRGAMAMFFAGQLFALKMGISVGGGSAGWILGCSATRPTWNKRNARCLASNSPSPARRWWQPSSS